MRWPWVSRVLLEAERAHAAAAAAAAEREIGHLRELLDTVRDDYAKLLDVIVRERRKEAGMPEVPRQQRVEIGKMPEALAAYIAAFASKSLQKDMRDRAYRRRVGGESWESIEASVMQPDEPEDLDDE